MPSKIVRVTLGAGSYTAFDPTINGRCRCTWFQATGINVRVIGESDSQPGLNDANYAFYPSSAQILFQMDLNPAKTWARADTGGGYIELCIQY